MAIFKQCVESHTAAHPITASLSGEPQRTRDATKHKWAADRSRCRRGLDAAPRNDVGVCQSRLD
ncbi:hypothetical protein F01_550057 [Burkholderia cenocepacia]|nr:hypothetical protein F01_550057 [Burkholderia cenocepacia]